MKNEIQIEISYYKIQKNFNLSRAALKDCKIYELTEPQEIDNLLKNINDSFYTNISGEFYEDIKTQLEKIKIKEVKYFFTLSKKDEYLLTINFEYNYSEEYLKNLDCIVSGLKENGLNPEINDKKDIIMNECKYYLSDKKAQKSKIFIKNNSILIDFYGKITEIQLKKLNDENIWNREVDLEFIKNSDSKVINKELYNDCEAVDEKYSNMENKYQEWRAEIYKNCQSVSDFFERLYRGRFWTSFSGQMKVYVNNKYILSNSASFIEITQEQYNEVEKQIRSGKPAFSIDFDVNLFDEEISKYKKEFKGNFKEFIFKRLSNYSDITRCLSLNLLKEKFGAESGRTKRIKSIHREFIIDENEIPENIEQIISALRPNPIKSH